MSKDITVNRSLRLIKESRQIVKEIIGFGIAESQKYDIINMLSLTLENNNAMKDIAKVLKTSPRYVGNVCGQNKHLLIIPCHRVVRSDGSLGGFSGLGGIKLKMKLINLERKWAKIF